MKSFYDLVDCELWRAGKIMWIVGIRDMYLVKCTPPYDDSRYIYQIECTSNKDDAVRFKKMIHAVRWAAKLGGYTERDYESVISTNSNNINVVDHQVPFFERILGLSPDSRTSFNDH